MKKLKKCPICNKKLLTNGNKSKCSKCPYENK